MHVKLWKTHEVHSIIFRKKVNFWSMYFVWSPIQKRCTFNQSVDKRYQYVFNSQKLMADPSGSRHDAKIRMTSSARPKPAHIIFAFSYKVEKILKGSLDSIPCKRKFKLWVGKFAWGSKAKHCWVMLTNFLFSKFCWQCSAMFCLYTSS